jgi:hypothetical protein
MERKRSGKHRHPQEGKREERLRENLDGYEDRPHHGNCKEGDRTDCECQRTADV